MIKNSTTSLYLRSVHNPDPRPSAVHPHVHMSNNQIEEILANFNAAIESLKAAKMDFSIQHYLTCNMGLRIVSNRTDQILETITMHINKGISS